MVWLPPPRNDVNSTAAGQNVKEDPIQMQGVTSEQDKTPLYVESNNVKGDTTQGENEVKPESQNKNVQQDFVPKTQEATDGSNLDAENDIVRTGSLQESDNQSNKTPETALQTTQNVQSFNLKQNSQKLNQKVLATNLIETTSSTTTNGGFDEVAWGKLDVTKWQGSVQDGVYQLTDYTGDLNHIIVPNEADFEKAGKSTNGLQVGITRDTVRSILSKQAQTIAFSKTNNQKVKAIGTDWSRAFSVDNLDLNLSKFDGSNLDVSNVTNMRSMFYRTSIDLASLANWDTSKVTDMGSMFEETSISNLTPLANWNVSNVTDMSEMFMSTSISDLTSLAHWDTSKVTDMDLMFTGDSISNLTPLANWNVSNVTGMSEMFENNKISDLKPLANWNVSNVTDMGWMFETNKISDLTPLSNWDTSKVTNMSNMLAENPDLIDLRPIANWNVSSVNNDYGFAYLFTDNTKLNLTNINNTPLMQCFLKQPYALGAATFITNNADLVKATVNKDLPTLTNTATRTITFKLPHAKPKTITQVINYKTIEPVQISFDPDSDSGEIVKTYPVKESDWYLDTSKQNDAIIVNGQVHFKAVTIPHINGYKAHLVRNKLNPAMFMVSFVAVPRETKPSLPDEETPSKPSAPADNPNKPTDELQQRVVTELNSNDSGWTMPADVSNATYMVEVPKGATIDLSDLVIAEPVHAQTRTQIHVTKRFKLSKKHLIKHLKHRKRVSKLFSKHYVLL